MQSPRRVLGGDKDVTVGELLRGKPFKMSVCATRMELDSIPTEESECKKYLFDLFEEKVARFLLIKVKTHSRIFYLPKCLPKEAILQVNQASTACHLRNSIRSR